MSIISKLMEEQGLTQVELAKRAHISQSTLSAIVNGSSPNAQTLEKLADALSVSVEELSEKMAEHSNDSLSCLRCGSKVVLEWTEHGTGACRLRCAYCEADTKEQKSRAQALRVFRSFRKAEQSTASLHVLTLEELLDLSCYDEDDVRPVWFENRGLFIVPSLVQCGTAEREGEYLRMKMYNGQWTTSYYFEQYGSWWRCWNSKPTMAQSDAVPWADAQSK